MTTSRGYRRFLANVPRLRAAFVFFSLAFANTTAATFARADHLAHAKTKCCRPCQHWLTSIFPFTPGGRSDTSIVACSHGLGGKGGVSVNAATSPAGRCGSGSCCYARRAAMVAMASSLPRSFASSSRTSLSARVTSGPCDRYARAQAHTQESGPRSLLQRAVGGTPGRQEGWLSMHIDDDGGYDDDGDDDGD
jgi:hypothetical protein